MAGTLGVAIATLYPNPRPSRPWIATLADKSGQLVGNLLPGASKSPNELSTDSEQAVSSQVSAAPTNLTPAQTEALRHELQQVQADLKQLRDRATALEAQLGIDPSQQALEQRVQALTQQLNRSASGQTDEVAVGSPLSEVGSRQASKPTITLPSDLLFAEAGSSLQPQAKALLSQLVSDLESYRGATIQIAGHTDNVGEAQANRDLSFNQAQAVQDYLTDVLGDRYRWVSVGYGSARPLVANDSDANRQRNRRLEISIAGGEQQP